PCRKTNMVRPVAIMAAVRIGVRHVLFTLSFAVLVGVGVLWVRSISRTDTLQLVTEKTNCSLGRREWTILTYRGGLLFDVRNIVYQRLASDPWLPDRSTLSGFTEPKPRSLSDVNAGSDLLGRMGFVTSNYSAVVRESPVVTQMGQ